VSGQSSIELLTVGFRERLRERPFKPHHWLPNAHLQTIAGSRLKRSFPWGWRESSSWEAELADCSRVEGLHVAGPHGSPTLVAVHGMAGSSRSGYMLGLSHKAYASGWGSLLLSLYDRNRERGRPRIFHAGCSREVDQILRIYASSEPEREMMVVGVSMGGNIVLKLLGEWGDEAPEAVRAAAVISPLVDLAASSPLMDRRANWLYRRYYVGRLKRRVLENAPQLRGHVDLRRLRRVRTVREFDEIVTVPLSGYRHVSDYYREAGAAPLLGRIRVPTLIVHSRDDPFLPAAPLETSAVADNPFITLVLTSAGGHGAFLEARPTDLDRCWAENRVIDFLSLAPGPGPVGCGQVF
jgi:uncharacterized protein